ncbi:MAG: hypothetical protein R6U61_08960 [Thermoplasmata archaeon]
MAEKLVCPICGTKIDEETGKCPNCGLTKSIIEMESSMEDLVDNEVEEVVNGFEKDLLDMGEDELYDVMKQFGLNSNVEEENGEEDVEIVVFECPICGSEVDENDVECPTCGAIFGEAEENEEAEFIEEFDRAKRELAKIRAGPISENIVKDLVKQAAMAGKEGDYEKGILRSREAFEMCKRIESFIDIVKEAKSHLKEIKENGGDYKTHLKQLMEAQKELERGEVEDSIEKSKILLKRLKEE